MANFTVTLTVGVAKGAAAVWSYNGSTSGVGTSYGNPLDVQIGDTVTFTRATSSAGTARIRLLNIFTSNADIDLTSSAPTVVRTVASGVTTLDSITGNNQAQSNTDTLFLERQAAPSITAPTASSVTFTDPASTNTTATVNLSASGSGGTLQYACEVGDSTPDNWQSGSTFTISRGTGTVYARARRSSTHLSNVVSATRPPPLITSPSNFDFTNQTSPRVALSSLRTSNTITIAGMSTGVTASISISGGQYLKNIGGVGWTTQSGSSITATNGDQFAVRHTSSSSFSTSTTTTLTVGGVSGSFVSTTIADNIAPVITRLPAGGSSIWNLTVGGSYSDPGATAADNLDGNITSSIVTVNPVNTAVVGTYTVTYNVSDAAGNAAPQVTRTVYVNPAPPVVNNTQNFAATESSSTSCNVSLTSSGTGGTLEYNKSTSQVIPTGVWYSTPTVTGLTRGTSYYFWARTANGSAYTDRTNASILVPYLPPKSFNYATTTNIPYVDTSHTLTITNGDPDHTYGWGIGVVGKGTAAYTNSSTITISSNSALPTAGASLNYEVLVKRGTTSGGSNSYVSITTTLPVNRYPQTPTASVGFNNPNDNDVTATVTASNTTGSNSLAYSNGGTYVAGNTFGAVRGTAANYYVRSTGANGLTATSTAAAATPGYNAPDAAITAIGAQNKSYGSTTTIFEIAGGNALDQYYVYNNAGSVSYGGRTGNGFIPITHGVAAGGSGTFRVYARRPIAVGGDNAFDSTNVSGVVIKVYPQTPTASVGFNNPNDNDVTATVTASNTTGSNSLAYSNGGTYVAGNTFAAVRGTAANYYVQSTGANSLTATSAATAATPGYNAPDASITAIASPNLAYGSTTHDVTIAGGNALDQYYVYNNAGSVSYGGRTGNGTITITHGVAAGGAATFRVYARRPVAVGGDNAFDDTGTTFEVEVYPNFPVLSVSNDNPSSASVTATLSATGGQGGTIEYAKTSYSSTTTYAQDRGTSVTYYARSVGSNGLISSVSTVSHAVGYITPSLTVYMNNVSIAHNDSSASVSIGSTAAGQVYAVRTVNGSTTLGSTTATSTTTVVSWTSSLPAQGNSTTYEIYVQRPTSIGGNNAWYDTNDQFTVTRAVAVTAPDAFDFTNQTGVALSSTRTSANTITIAGLSSGINASVTISGGQYSKNLASYSSQSGITATNGDTFKVRHTSSSSNSTSTTTTLTVGGVSGSFVSTTVADTTAPVITVTGANPATVLVGASYTDAGATADGGETVSSSGTVNTSVVGAYTITYSATDAANNTGTATRTVNVVDTAAPVITLLGSTSVTLNVGGTYSDAGATATDNADGNITSSIVTVNPVNVNAAGTYTVTYNVSDAAGNAATQVTRSVTAYAVPDTTITQILNKTVAFGSTTFVATIASGSSTTVYEVKDFNTNPATGTVHASQTGNGDITVSDMPSAGSSKLYMITGRVTAANGGDNTPFLAETFEVFQQTSGGTTTGGGGSGTYGIQVRNASNEIILDVTDRVVILRQRVTGSIPAADLTKNITLSGTGTCALNLALPTALQSVVNGLTYSNTHLIVWATLSGTTLTINRKFTNATNVSGSSLANAAAPYDFLVLFDPET